jgi:archaellum component FlaC
MDRFDMAVAEQLKTMDKLLFLQGEMERCQKMENQLFQREEETEQLHELKAEIARLKNEITQIQAVFESQTEEAIRSYHLQESL